MNIGTPLGLSSGELGMDCGPGGDFLDLMTINDVQSYDSHFVLKRFNRIIG